MATRSGLDHLRGSLEAVEWKEATVSRLQSLRDDETGQSYETLGKLFPHDSLSEFAACRMLYLSFTSSIKIPMRRLARSGAVLTDTRLMGCSLGAMTRLEDDFEIEINAIQWEDHL